MSKYDLDLDYAILGIDISRNEIKEIIAEAGKIISENKENNENIAAAYLKKAQCLRKLEYRSFSDMFHTTINLELMGMIKSKRIKILLEKALELFPDMPEAIMQMGLLINSGCFRDKITEAINFFNKAIKLKPDYAAAFNNRAMSFYKSAIYDYEYHLICENYEKKYSENAKINLKNALTDLTEAIRLRPFDSLYQLNRGIVNSMLGEYNKAVENISNAINYASDVLRKQLIKDTIDSYFTGEKNIR